MEPSARSVRRQEERARARELAAEVRAVQRERATERERRRPERSRRAKIAWAVRTRKQFVDPNFTAKTFEGRHILSAWIEEDTPEWKAFLALASKYVSDMSLLKSLWMSPKMGKK